MRVLKLLLFCLLLAIFLEGCLKPPVSSPIENIPPETYCFIAHVDTVDTVPARVTLYWYGNDPDGEVVGYYYAIDDRDTTFTTKTTEIFIFRVEAGDTYATHKFEVWAVDKEGAVDPTPARVVIPVRNTPPTAFFIRDKLPQDTTLPVATFYFGATDLDGDKNILGFLYRVDWEPETLYHFISKDSACIFLTNIPPGERTICLRAVDESYTMSPEVYHTWYVKPVVGKILLIDDANVNQADLFFRNFLEVYYPEQYTSFRVESGLPYSFLDMDYAINELGFDLIIWYTADQMEHFSPLISSFTRYLDSGKKLVLVSPSVLNIFFNPNLPSSPFARNYLGVDTVTAFDKFMVRNEKLYPQITGYDSLICNMPIISRFDGFESVQSAKVIYRLPTTTRWTGNPACVIAYPSENPSVIFASIQLYGFTRAEEMLRIMISSELVWHP